MHTNGAVMKVLSGYLLGWHRKGDQLIDFNRARVMTMIIYRRTSISGRTFSGKKCLSGTMLFDLSFPCCLTL
jgi:hypothetical protein